jgi:ketosteroid isomerase-like protein
MALLFAAALLLACTGAAIPPPSRPGPLSVTASGTTTAVTAPAHDAAALTRQLADAINRGDPAAARALFAAEATWERGNQCPPGQCAGLARLGQEIDRDIANHHRLDITQLDTTGATATARIELRNDGTRAGGVERTIQTFTVTAGGGKIAALRAENDLSDPQTAAFATRGGRQ